MEAAMTGSPYGVRKAVEGLMHLVTTWVVSAVAGTVAYPIGGLIAATLLGSPLVVWRGLFGFGLLYVFVFCLVLQFVYGGLLYLVLAHLGLVSLPLVLMAYLVPSMLFVWAGSDRPKDLIMAIPMLLSAASLAIVA
jgi:hypothetical protein